MRHSQGESVTTVDVDAMFEVEIELPEGVAPEEVEVVGEFCDARGQRDEGMDLVVVKAASKAPAKKPETKRGSRGTAKADEKTADTPVVDPPAADKPPEDKAADNVAKP